ncbi:MAG TPA: YezD family protein [Verrucomicrobiae bacterium]|nr:YezD family protein [Verrucomicrobiae bacterium]
MSTAATQDWLQDLTTNERELLREVALALRSIRYGSVVLTVHDGRIVELNKTERIRKAPG